MNHQNHYRKTITRKLGISRTYRKTIISIRSRKSGNFKITKKSRISGKTKIARKSGNSRKLECLEFLDLQKLKKNSNESIVFKILQIDKNHLNIQVFYFPFSAVCKTQIRKNVLDLWRLTLWFRDVLTTKDP